MAKILYADDNGFMRDIAYDSLQTKGFEVITAPDGKDAIEALKTKKSIDLVISDGFMTNVHGLAVLKYIRESGNGYSNVPFILTSSDEYNSFTPHIGDNSGIYMFKHNPINRVLPFAAALVLSNPKITQDEFDINLEQMLPYFKS
jgi:two-component system response regulator MprA